MRSALKIALIYVCFSILYITFGDQIVLPAKYDNFLFETSQIQTIKGILFVIVSGVLIYLIANNYFEKSKKALPDTGEFQSINKNIISTMSDGIGVVNSEGQIVTGNDSFFDFVQFPEHFSKQDAHIDHIKNLEIKETIHESLISKNKHADKSFKLDSNKWVKLELLHIRHAGDDSFLLIHCSDISFQMSREKELLEKEQEFLSIFEKIPFGIILFDKSGILKFCNTRADQLTNFDFASISGENLQDIVEEEDRPFFKEKWHDSMNNNSMLHARCKVTNSVNKERWIQFDAFPISNEERKGHLLIMRDISIEVILEQQNQFDSNELKKIVDKRTREVECKNERLEKSQLALTYLIQDVNEIQNELEGTNNKLAIANQELEAFSYSVSHDLRAPLRSINGFSQALIEDYKTKLDDTGIDYLNRIRKGTVKMGHLIEDILVLSSISRKEIQISKNVNITKISREIIKELGEDNPDQQVAFEIHDKIYCIGDANLLKILFSNLIGNAWKFTAKNENAKISIGLENGEIFVRDNGIGFDIKYVDKIFEPFQRLHSSKEYNGSGIGLAIVKRIVQRHEAKIRVSSALGEGTTFFLSFSIRNTK